MPNSFHLKVQSLYFRELAYIEELKGPRHEIKKIINFSVSNDLYVYLYVYLV